MYKESELVSIAKRENNNKRAYLVVNKLQGKHIPVSPTKAFRMFDALGQIVKEAYPNETLLLIGFAETATAIGARLAILLHSYYIQTTREEISDVNYLFFTEAHSHATEQKLVREDIEAIAEKAERIVFVEDEVTTGNTILNIIDILKKCVPSKVRFSVASLLNGMNEEALSRYADREIKLHFLVKTNHEAYTKIAEAYSADGDAFSLCDKETASLEEYTLCAYQNARRLTTGEAYAKACEALWKQIQKELPQDGNENLLILGTEEFMYPALFVGACLEVCGNTVKCHSTTRSPIAVSKESGYFPHSRYELCSLYEDERKTFVYELAKYDRVILLTDAANASKKGENSLVNALLSCGNEKIQLFRWCEK